MKKTITPKQSAALGYLLEGKTVAQSARLANVSERQLYRWLEDGPFKAQLHQAQGRTLDLVGAQLLNLANDAVTTLGILQADPPARADAPGAGVQLRAAVALLDLSLKWREQTDLEARLQALEEKIK